MTLTPDFSPACASPHLSFPHTVDRAESVLAYSRYSITQNCIQQENKKHSTAHSPHRTLNKHLSAQADLYRSLRMCTC